MVQTAAKRQRSQKIKQKTDHKARDKTKHNGKPKSKQSEKAKDEITFLDRLSRLTFMRTVKLLGAEGKALIIAGGKYELGVLDEVLSLDQQGLNLRVAGCIARIAPDPMRPKSLTWSCSACSQTCEHIGAAFSLVLEEKTALGLAKAPDLEPVESMTDEAAAAAALLEREDRADKEKMHIRWGKSKSPWSDYAITNALSGKTYRVALRSFEDSDNYCSCPDFRVNTLGTCKHILHVQNKAKKRFSKQQRDIPYARQGFAIAMRYRQQQELHLLPPTELSASTKRVLGGMHKGAISDIHRLMRVIPKLERQGHEIRFHPDAELYIQQCLHQDRLSSVVADIRANPEKHPLRTSLLNAELLPYQLDGIAFAAGIGRAILADDMGLGKTIQGIGVAEFLAQYASIKRVLIVCPASLKGQWKLEIERFSDRSCSLVQGATAARPEQYASSNFFIIANYEQILRDHHAISHVSWDLIILDEGQRIKNWQAQTSQIMKSLRSPFALVLSGTPLENRLDDLYSIAQFIDDRHLGPRFHFMNRYQLVNQKGRVLGYKKIDEIRERLRPFLLRRTRAALLKQLPKRSTEIVRVTASTEQVKIARGQKRIIAQIIGKAYISEMDMLRLRQALLQSRMVADSTYLCDKINPGHSTKLERMRELLADLAAEDGRKVLIFSEWTTMLDLIQPILDDCGLNYVRLDGKVPQKKRQNIVNQFQQNPDCRVFLTTNAGSTGLNLQAADTVINVDLPWNPAVLEQRIARAHRMGQKRPVQVYLMVSEGTIEEGMLGTLANKAEMALAVLDSESELTDVSVSSGIDELKRKMEILLGNPEAACEDDGHKQEVIENIRKQAQRKERLEEAGGKMLTSAFEFLAQAMPAANNDTATDNSGASLATVASVALSKNIEESLRACSEQDDKGHLRLSIDLGDGSALKSLAASLATIMSAGGS